MSKRDELAAVLASATWPGGDTSGFPTKRVAGMLADAVLAWLGGQLDPLLTAVDIVLAEAGDDADEDPNLGEMAFCARELLAHLVLDGAAQDAQEGLCGPGSGGVGSGEGSSPTGAQIVAQCGQCLACDPPTGLMHRMYLCATCGNKRCPAGVDCIRWQCSGSNEPDQIPVPKEKR